MFMGECFFLLKSFLRKITLVPVDSLSVLALRRKGGNPRPVSLKARLSGKWTRTSLPYTFKMLLGSHAEF